MSPLLYSGKSITSCSLGDECIQQSLAVSGEFSVLSSGINSPGSVQVSSRTCHKSFQASHSSGSLLDGGSLASHSSQHVGRHSSGSHHKGPYCGCFCRSGDQGSAMAAFNPLVAKRCLLCIQGCSSSVLSGNGGGNTCTYNVGLWGVLERMSGLVCSKGCTKQCHICL